ncbi:hypothetical protein KI387_010843, partial [Taxus chinensis]
MKMEKQMVLNGLRKKMKDIPSKFMYDKCKYVGIDISESALEEARRNLTELVGGLEPSAIEFLHVNFMKGLQQ